MLHVVKEGFAESETNPITNKRYDNSWIVFCLTSSEKYEMICGRGKGAYTVKVSKGYKDWKMSVIDFLEFHTAYNKNIILSISKSDLKEAKEYYLGHHYNERDLRKNEPSVLIHSTTLENWESIKEDGYLKSWNILKAEKENWEDQPIGNNLGDPADFSDYIMFSGGNISSEIVVLSKQHGRITMDEDMEYVPGVRLYFDIKRIAEDGLLIRDGAHLKVRNKLSLYPYLLWVGDWKSIGLTQPRATPKIFTELANQKFSQLFNTTI